MFYGLNFMTHTQLHDAAVREAANPTANEWDVSQKCWDKRLPSSGKFTQDYIEDVPFGEDDILLCQFDNLTEGVTDIIRHARKRYGKSFTRELLVSELIEVVAEAEEAYGKPLQ
jgi:hypothetical protein